MKKELEIFVAESVYHLARSILEGHRTTGFNYYDENDMREVGKVNCAAYLLDSLADERHDRRAVELRMEAGSMIYFSPKLEVIPGGKQ